MQMQTTSYGGYINIWQASVFLLHHLLSQLDTDRNQYMG